MALTQVEESQLSELTRTISAMQIETAASRARTEERLDALASGMAEANATQREMLKAVEKLTTLSAVTHDRVERMDESVKKHEIRLQKMEETTVRTDELAPWKRLIENRMREAEDKLVVAGVVIVIVGGVGSAVLNIVLGAVLP